MPLAGLWIEWEQKQKSVGFFIKLPLFLLTSPLIVQGNVLCENVSIRQRVDEVTGDRGGRGGAPRKKAEIPNERGELWELKRYKRIEKKRDGGGYEGERFFSSSEIVIIKVGGFKE